MYKVAVIGGGASGIMAALTAQKNGAKAVILEKNARIGKKLLVTGNGRCNFTNIDAAEKNYNSDFVEDALGQFTPQNTIEFFEEIGMLASVQDEGRVYPISEQAAAVLDVLLMELLRRKIEILTEFDVKNIKKTANGFEILSANGKKVLADRVIFSTGGMAAPKTGSGGDGYELLKKFGHTTKKIEPALVGVKTDKGIAGVRATARVSVNGKNEIGEVQFTAYGLSGIPIFNLSRYIKAGDEVVLDMLPNYDENTLVKCLKNKPNQKLETFLIGIINKQLGQMLLKELNLGKLSRESKDLSDKEILLIARRLKKWRFVVSGKMSWENAQVTMGGISLLEVDKHTMESKKQKGIFITGELLDIDAICGGYNLQWAWSSGFVAGKFAAEN